MHTLYLIYLMVVTALWLAFNFIYGLIQGLIWLINGTYSKRWEGERRPDSKTSAQVMNVIGRWRLDIYISPALREDFLLTHDRFEAPEYVLQDHITLYKVTKKEAFFVEAKPGEEVWRSRTNPGFLVAAQFFKAVKVIRLPIASFHVLSDRLGDPKGKLIIVSNCARCGSTILTQMFEVTQKVIAFSEPNCMNLLAFMEDSGQSGKEFERLVIASVRLLCKPTSLKEIAYVLKLTAPAMQGIKLLNRLFPESKNFYLYRDYLKVAQSLARTSHSLPSMKAIYTFGRNSKSRLMTLVAQTGLPRTKFNYALKHDLSIGFMLWGVLTNMYYEYRDEGVDIRGLRYEDMVEKPLEFMKKLFNFIGLPENLAEKCPEALEFDSQQGTPLSREVLMKFPTCKYEGEAKVECDWLSKQLKLPRLDEPFIARGTFSTDLPPTIVK